MRKQGDNVASIPKQPALSPGSRLGACIGRLARRPEKFPARGETFLPILHIMDCEDGGCQGPACPSVIAVPGHALLIRSPSRVPPPVARLAIFAVPPRGELFVRCSRGQNRGGFGILPRPGCGVVVSTQEMHP